MKRFGINQTHNFNWYIIMWGVGFFVALYLFNAWHIKQNYLGIVENKSHLVGAQESGRLSKLLVNVGDQVKQGQVLAVLDISDLKTGLSQLREELSNIKSLEQAHNDRFSIFMQRMSLELENQASNLIDRLSLLESKSTELAGLNAEINRLKEAEQAGLGHNRDLTSLVLQRDALATYLKEQSKDLKFQSQKLEKTRRSRELFEKADYDSMARSVFLERMEHAEALRREVSVTENRIRLRTLIAPCDGYVTEILARPGDVVAEFIPVITVDEIKPRFTTIYIPEKSTVKPEPGMKVDIKSARSSDFNTTGIVSFVHPGFSRANERLSFRGQVFWARKVRVELPKDHNLIPGEVIDAKLGELAGDEDYIAKATASENPGDSENSERGAIMYDMQVPTALYKKSRFEPSGVTWIPELEKYLIVSDDTGLDKTKSEHAPYLFFMNENGEVEEQPVILNGVETVNDLEAITYAGKGIYYIVSSQNISKKGKRPKNREQILKVRRTGETFDVLSDLNLISLLQSFSHTERLALGLEKYEEDGKPLLNIEGATFLEGDLYFGLKEPVTENGAILWRLENIEAAFENGDLQKDQLSIYGTVDLGSNENRAVSFSDLVFDKDGVLWALGTVANIQNKDQVGGFYRIKIFENGAMEAQRLLSFPGVKPEGLCLQGERFLITFDKDDNIPAFCYVDSEAL